MRTEAGWYRYVSRWGLHADGTIRARYGHGGAADDIVLEHNDPRGPAAPRTGTRCATRSGASATPGVSAAGATAAAKRDT